MELARSETVETAGLSANVGVGESTEAGCKIVVKLAWTRVLGTALAAARNPLHFFATLQGSILPEESTRSGANYSLGFQSCCCQEL